MNLFFRSFGSTHFLSATATSTSGSSNVRRSRRSRPEKSSSSAPELPDSPLLNNSDRSEWRLSSSRQEIGSEAESRPSGRASTSLTSVPWWSRGWEATRSPSCRSKSTWSWPRFRKSVHCTNLTETLCRKIK